MAFEITVDERIEAAADPTTFDVLEFIKGSALPTDTVVFYTDVDAGYRLSKILLEEEAQRRKSASDGYGLADDFEDNEEEITELKQRLDASALVFELRGLAPAAVTALNNHIKATHNYKEGTDNEEYSAAFNSTLAGKSIVSVTSPSGARQEGNWTAEKVLELSEEANPGEWAKLFNAILELNFAYNVFDSVVNADFS